MIKLESSDLNPFKMSTTVPHYDDLLNGKDTDYYKLKFHEQANLVWMSPEEYLEGCAKIFNTSYDKQYSQGNTKETNTYAKNMKDGNKFPLPYLNYVNSGQEGRHRAVACMKLGISKIPVLVISEYDPYKELNCPDGVHISEYNIIYYTKDGEKKFANNSYSIDKAKKIIDDIRKSGNYLSSKEIEELESKEDNSDSDSYDIDPNYDIRKDKEFIRLMNDIFGKDWDKDLGDLL